MTEPLQRAIAAGKLAEAGTLALALAQLGELTILDLIGLTSLLSAQGKMEQTIALYQAWLAHCESPLTYVAWYNLAVVQLQTGELASAERSYRLSLQQHPGFTEGQLGLGALLERQRQPEAALAQWHQALDDLDRSGAEASTLRIRLYNEIARVAAAQGDLQQAEQALLHSLQRDPRQTLIAQQWLWLRQQLCAWPVIGFVPGLSDSALRHAASALSILSLSDDAGRQLAAAQRAVRNTRAPAPAALADAAGYTHHKLRIGYLSCGFGAQAVGRLLAELLERHDRELVEVVGFCWSAEDGSALRQRLLRAMDVHVQIATLSDVQAAQAIRSHEIDILIDLHGHLPGARPGILQQRPAPVQIGWLGQPGPSGMSVIDYVLADAVMLPPALALHYTEQILYLPHCYLPQDGQRALSPPLSPLQRAALRAELGLPEPGFVYCCLCAPEQLTPERYATWMRILAQVPDSVLWLQTASEAVRDNLRVAAMQHGVASERLCFTELEPASVRYQAADLFLDSAPYAAGALAGEVLWAGLPLLTCTGRSSASRTSASVLQAAGLPELISASERAYETKAVRLAKQPQQLMRLRNRLRRQRPYLPLFDTAQLARDLEALYLRVARGRRTRAEARQIDQPGPLVSILIATDDPLALATTLASALAQSYGCCEIIVSDSSLDGVCQPLLKPYLKTQRRLRYARAPGLPTIDNLNHCLALALGVYVAVAPAGDTLAADKIATMLPYLLDHPHISVVASWRQPRTADGQALPAAPLFASELIVSGASLASLLLSSGDGGPAAALAAACTPGALLCKRAAIGTQFGHYLGRRYRDRADVATALSVLANGDYLYLPQPLSSYCIVPPVALPPLAQLEAAIEALELLCQAHVQGQRFDTPTHFRQLLAARLAALNTLLVTQHTELAASTSHQLDALQRAMRTGLQLLLAE